VLLVAQGMAATRVAGQTKRHDTCREIPFAMEGRTRASGHHGGEWKPIVHRPAQILLTSMYRSVV